MLELRRLAVSLVLGTPLGVHWLALLQLSLLEFDHVKLLAEAFGRPRNKPTINNAHILAPNGQCTVADIMGDYGYSLLGVLSGGGRLGISEMRL